MQIDFEIVHGLLYVPDMCVPVKEYIGSDKQTDRMSQRRAPQKKRAIPINEGREGKHTGCLVKAYGIREPPRQPGK